jgi:glycosyltransferase involved in cell wall biosynthesis
MNPAVTILMPAYNAAAYIGEAIQSVLDQDFADYELLIIDDGSTDDTVAVVQQFNDARIRLAQQKNAGVAAALNYGLKLAHSNLVARFDADDICLPGRLRMQYRFMQDHPDYVLVGGEAEYMDEAGEWLFDHTCPAYHHEEIVAGVKDFCPFIHSAVMYRKQAVLDAGAYEVHAHNFEDHFLWTKMVHTGKCANLPQKLIKVRFNPQSVTLDDRWRGAAFQNLKKKIIREEKINAEQGEQLLQIIQGQDNSNYKRAAYHALCGKKYLTNNYQPRKARKHLGKAIGLKPFRMDNYLFYFLSLLPKRFIDWLYTRKTALPV